MPDSETLKRRAAALAIVEHCADNGDRAKAKADADLKAAIRAAIAVGVPKTDIADAARIHRSTLYEWEAS